MPLPVPPSPRSGPQPNPLQGFLRMIDWRLVAAIGLPLWAFLLGVVVTRKPAPPVPPAVEPIETAAVVPTPPPPQPAPPAPPPPVAPPPPEVIIRTELQPLPVVIPVPVTAEPVVAVAPAPAVEFKLPASEVMPADRCKTYDTKLRFHPDLATAAEEAKTSKKMLLVLHISGNFDDPGFT
jgi:hypothetical protein